MTRRPDHLLILLFQAVKDFWEARKEAARKEAFDNGYAYAQGELSKSKKVDETLQRLMCESSNPFDRSSFDGGIDAAVFDFLQKDTSGLYGQVIARSKG